MRIHKKIRENIIELLDGQIDGIDNFYSSRPLFIDIDQEKAAIAVFLDEIEAQEISLCHHEWQAFLNIAIYLKTAEGEDELDDIAEQVKQKIAQAIEDDSIFKFISEISLTHFDYEQDATNRTWFVANVRYQIQYED